MQDVMCKYLKNEKGFSSYRPLPIVIPELGILCFRQENIRIPSSGIWPKNRNCKKIPDQQILAFALQMEDL